MKNQTVYTYDLLFKAECFTNKKLKKKIGEYLLLAGLMIAIPMAFIIRDMIFGNNEWDSGTAYFAVFFFGFFCAFALLYLKTRKSGVSKNIKKQIETNPNRVLEYSFEQDCVVIDQKSQMVQSNVCISLSFIDQTIKIDDKTFCLITKSNVMYIVYDEDGIDGYLDYIKENIK